MRWSEIFNINKKCLHTKVPMDVDFAYCPDCGELVENHWYITRCACCGVKLPAAVINGEVVPEDNFCHNCGSKSYVVEEIEKIDCININYAVMVRKTVENNFHEYAQSWQESIRTSGYIPKLQQ